MKYNKTFYRWLRVCDLNIRDAWENDPNPKQTLTLLNINNLPT